jgi:hypothetical protein
MFFTEMLEDRDRRKDKAWQFGYKVLVLLTTV